MRELALRGCEVARMSAAAIAAGISTGAAEALDFVRGCEEELDTLDRQINEGVTTAICGASEADARELLSCLKMILETERVGDLLLNVANRAPAVKGRIGEQDAGDLKRMAELLEQMLADALVSFRDRDLQRAISILRTDTEMDRLRNLLFVRHIDNPENQPRHQSFHLVFMTQTLERAGDHAKNMAEEVCHLVTGRSIRHVIRAADKPVEQMFLDWMRRQGTKH
jgi:phosphate transport system protein